MIDAPINMEEFENAIHKWFTDATGLTTVWTQQGAPQPEYPFGTLEITSGPSQASPLWDYETDFDETRPPGKEVRFVTCVPCTFNISCQVFVGMPEGRDPNKNAMQYLSRAKAALQLPSFRDELAAKNIASLFAGSVQNIGELIEDSWVSRANMDVTFGASLSVEEFMGYIDKVEISKTNDPKFDLLVDAS